LTARNEEAQSSEVVMAWNILIEMTEVGIPKSTVPRG
jgi:hypothetical protein